MAHVSDDNFRSLKNKNVNRLESKVTKIKSQLDTLELKVDHIQSQMDKLTFKNSLQRNIKNTVSKLGSTLKVNQLESENKSENESEKESKKEIIFKTPDDITDEKIDDIFSNGMKLIGAPSNISPYFIFLIGSPGVGKTYMLNKTFGKRLDNFYKVSLDSILERIQPFRKATKEIYNILKPGQDTKSKNYPDVKFSSNNYSALNFSTLYQTKKPFNIEISEKLKEKKSKAQKIQDERKIQEGGYEALTTISKKAIENAIKQRYNIIYDTTLTPTFSKITEIMNVLESNINGEKYKICVILVEAEGNDEEQAEIIRKRINERHQTMIKEGYIRTIRKSLIANSVDKNTGKVRPGYITTNREGWKKARKFFSENGAYNKENHKYNSSDIIFLKPNNVQNLQKNITNSNTIDSIIHKMKENTKKNNNNNNNNNNSPPPINKKKSTRKKKN